MFRILTLSYITIDRNLLILNISFFCFYAMNIVKKVFRLRKIFALESSLGVVLIRTMGIYFCSNQKFLYKISFKRCNEEKKLNKNPYVIFFIYKKFKISGLSNVNNVYTLITINIVYFWKYQIINCCFLIFCHHFLKCSLKKKPLTLFQNLIKNSFFR